MTCLTGGRTFVKVMFKPQRATQNRKMNTPRYLSVLPTAEWLQKKDGFGNGKSCILALPLAVCGSFECGGGGWQNAWEHLVQRDGRTRELSLAGMERSWRQCYR